MLTTIWAALFLFSFVASVLFALHLLLRTLSKSWMHWDRIGATLALVSAAVMAVDGLQLLNCFQYQQFQPWSNFPLIAGVLGYGWLCLRGWTWRGTRLQLIKQPLVSCLLFATAGISIWSWHRLNSTDIMGEFALDCCTPGQMVEEQRFVGLSDTGSRLPLYRLDVSEEQFEKFAIASKERIAKLAEPLIVRAEPTQACNCHGWVFTGGKHLIRGENVQQILNDNGYSRITNPNEDDIVIYRSVTGNILHSGLVSTVLADNTILIESKWGVDGRFLHRPENQPYSQSIEYYRRSRASHVITLKSTEAADKILALSTAQNPLQDAPANF